MNNAMAEALTKAQLTQSIKAQIAEHEANNSAKAAAAKPVNVVRKQKAMGATKSDFVNMLLSQLVVEYNSQGQMVISHPSINPNIGQGCKKIFNDMVKMWAKNNLNSIDSETV